MKIDIRGGGGGGKKKIRAGGRLEKSLAAKMASQIFGYRL